MAAKRSSKPKKSPQSRRRAMDAEQGRHAQLWWMFGVGAVLLLSAIYQNTRPVQARSERGPAQIRPVSSASLPNSRPQFK